MARINERRTYRHDVSGAVGEYPTRLGDADPHLIEVDTDAKPLAFTPIPREAVENLLASREDKSDEGNSSTTKKRSK